MARKPSKKEIHFEMQRKADQIKRKRLELEYFNKNRGNIARGTADHWSTSDLVKVLKKCKNFKVSGDYVTVIDNYRFHETKKTTLAKALIFFQYWNVDLTERELVMDQLSYALEFIGKLRVDADRVRHRMPSLFDIKAYEAEQKRNDEYWKKVKDPVAHSFKAYMAEALHEPTLIDIEQGNY